MSIHKHTWKTISFAHTKDYNYKIMGKYGLYSPTTTDDGGEEHLWGKPITVFTQECIDCHKLQDYEVDGYQQLIEDDKEEKHDGKKKLTE